MKASSAKRVAPLDKLEATKRLRSLTPLSREFRNRLADFLEGKLPARRGAPPTRPRYTVRQALLIREWLKEETASLRHAHKEAQKKPGIRRTKFDREGALDKLVAGWGIKSHDLESRISKTLSGKQSEVARILEGRKDATHAEPD